MDPDQRNAGKAKYQDELSIAGLKNCMEKVYFSHEDPHLPKEFCSIFSLIWAPTIPIFQEDFPEVNRS